MKIEEQMISWIWNMVWHISKVVPQGTCYTDQASTWKLESSVGHGGLAGSGPGSQLGILTFSWTPSALWVNEGWPSWSRHCSMGFTCRVRNAKPRSDQVSQTTLPGLTCWGGGTELTQYPPPLPPPRQTRARRTTMRSRTAGKVDFMKGIIHAQTWHAFLFARI